MTQDFMKKPFRLLVKREDLSLQGIRQFYVSVEKDCLQSTGHNGTELHAALECACFAPGRMEIRHAL